jgi:hypothetical protein
MAANRYEVSLAPEISDLTRGGACRSSLRLWVIVIILNDVASFATTAKVS